MSSCGSCHVPMCSTQSAWTHGYSQVGRALSVGPQYRMKSKGDFCYVEFYILFFIFCM
ncbi:hypothetical protein ACJIZ3_007573 [Penstemon smallii]|uniref:Uncharacterized protein n=1 Tax=Penstemon smallii TaxID=265156 RepID=A0ABD3T917_9LAMI